MGTMSTTTDLSSVSLTYCGQPEVQLNTRKKFNMEEKMKEKYQNQALSTSPPNN